MVNLKVTKPFKFAENGVIVIDYQIGEHEVSEECAEYAVTNKLGKVIVGKDALSKKEIAKRDEEIKAAQDEAESQRINADAEKQKQIGDAMKLTTPAEQEKAVSDANEWYEMQIQEINAALAEVTKAT